MTTTYFSNCVMGNLFRTQTTPALPTSFYIGLSTSAPTASGTNVTEPSDSAYARVKLSSLSVPANGVVKNSQEISFADSTVDWGTITHFVIYDAATGGNLLIYNTVDKPRLVQADSSVKFEANGLKLSLKDVAS